MGGAGWSWVEVKMRWVEVDKLGGAEWRWVHSLIIPKIKQQNRHKRSSIIQLLLHIQGPYSDTPGFFFHSFCGCC